MWMLNRDTAVEDEIILRTSSFERLAKDSQEGWDIPRLVIFGCIYEQNIA